MGNDEVGTRCITSKVYCDGLVRSFNYSVIVCNRIELAMKGWIGSEVYMLFCT